MKILIKFFVVLTAVFCMQYSCFASPIPIFELFGWIEDKNATIDEYKYDEDGYSKRIKNYSKFNNSIDEYEYDEDGYSKRIKRYSL